MPNPLAETSSARRGVPAAGVPGGQGLGVVQAGLLTIAVLYFGRDLFIPLVLAVLLSFVLAPVVRAMRRVRIPRPPAVLMTVLLAFALLCGLGVMIGRQLTVLAGNLPSYQARIAQKIAPLQDSDGLLERLSRTVQNFEREIRPRRAEEGRPATAAPPGTAATPSPPGAAAVPRSAAPPPAGAGRRSDAAPENAAETGPPPVPVELHTPEPTPVARLREVAEPLLGPLATTGIVIVFVVFILLSREDLRDRLIRLAGARDLHRTVAAMDDAAYRLSRFFLVQTTMNATYGVFMAAALWLLGVPNPVLWGIIAGLMRFVPFIGSFIAVAGPLLLALAVDPGWSMVLWVAALFLVSELAMGQVFEPLIFGHSTGLSPIAVIAAATFWTWLWGPIGLLLAVPLTVCLVVLGRHVDRLEFLEVMLGDRPPLEPEEIFYQRALAGDSDALVEQAERALREQPLSAYYDEVALKGLALAQGDWSRDALDPDRLQTIRQQVETLLDDVADEEDAPPVPPLVGNPSSEGEGTATGGGPDGAVARPPAAWGVPGSVLCIAGRGRFDDLAAEMLAQVLGKHGIGARAEPNAALRTANLDRIEAAPVRLCVLSVLEGGSSAASAQYFLRRVRRRMPEATVALGLWQAGPDSPTLAAIRAESGGGSGSGERGTEIMTSLREAVAYCLLIAARDAEAGAAAAGPTPAAADAGRGAASTQPGEAAPAAAGSG